MSIRIISSVTTLIFTVAVAIALVSCGEDTPQGPLQPVINGGDTGPDTVAPAAVTDILLKLPSASKMTLQWFAPGDDDEVGQAARYDIRWSTSEITEQSWVSATSVPDVPDPEPAGSVEQIVVKGLPSSSEVHFAMKTYDEVPNESDLSACVSNWTTSEDMPPAEVTDLRVQTISDTEMLLTWTAPGDDWTLPGRASQYDIRYDFAFSMNSFRFADAQQVQDEPSPRPQGEADSCLVTGLEPGENYFFALTTADEVGNESGISNVAVGLSTDDHIFVSPTVVYINQTRKMEIFFKTIDAGARAQISMTRQVYDWGIGGFVTTAYKHLVDATYPAGVHYVTWDLTDDDGAPATFAWGQTYVRVHWGATPVDSVFVRFQN